ncbi:MAG: translation elongation factor Ts [Bacilli bacterium]|nr:translation elongation factor Ts [Bacilli bacterium]
MMITAIMVKELREVTGAGMLDCKKALEETNGNMDNAIDWLREKGISKAAKKASRIATEGLASAIIDGNNGVIVEVNSETDFVAKNEEFKGLVASVTEVLVKNNVETVEEALELTIDGTTLNDLIVAKTSKIGEKLSLRRFKKVTKAENDNFGIYIHMGGKIVVLVVVENATEEVAKDVAMHVAAMKPQYVNRSEVEASVLEKEKAIIKEQAINEGKPADIAEKMVSGRINKFYKEACLEEQEFVKNNEMTVGAYVQSNGGKIKTMIRFEVGEGMEKREDNFAEEVMNQLNK